MILHQTRKISTCVVVSMCQQVLCRQMKIETVYVTGDTQQCLYNGCMRSKILDYPQPNPVENSILPIFLYEHFIVFTYSIKHINSLSLSCRERFRSTFVHVEQINQQVLNITCFICGMHLSLLFFQKIEELQREIYSLKQPLLMTNIGLDNVSNSMRHFSLKSKITVSHFIM